MVRKQMGCHLNNAEDWWTVLWYRLKEFREKHLQQISELATEKGIWMDVEVQFTFGRVKD